MNIVSQRNRNAFLFIQCNLRPSYFINADLHKFIFTNINWENSDGSSKAIATEILASNERAILNPYRLLAITCRQLANNGEENYRLEESSNFRKMAFEIDWMEKKKKFWNWINLLPQESEKLKKRFGGSTEKEDEAIKPTDSFGIVKRFDFLHLLYRFTSAITAKVGVGHWLCYLEFGFLLQSSIHKLTFRICPRIKTDKEVSAQCETRDLYFAESMKQSFATMVLQKSETRKPLGTAETFILLQTVLSPLQIALLALAVRRRFMRK